jgi:LPS O-antigen subunit length determinant protein (WzzB/FepE family)
VSPVTPQELHVSLDKALGAANGKKEATLMTMRRWESAQTTLKLTYLDRNPGQAQRVAEQLTAAIATSNREGTISTEVLSAPDLPTSPIKPDYRMNVASGGGVGLVAGCVVLLLGWRRGPARSR